MTVNSSLQKKLGQNTAEYLILLVLVAVGTIGIFSIFGGTLKSTLNNAIVAISGGTPTPTATFVTGAAAAAKDGTGMKIEAADIKRF